MSLWLEVFSPNPPGDITPEDLAAGIGKRLKALTYLYCPDDEEEPEIVMNRLKITSNPKFPRALFIHARKEPEKFIRMDRDKTSPRSEIVKARLDTLDLLPNQEDSDLNRVRQFLNSTRENTGFQLMFSDMQTMGWPVAVAAAAWIAEIGAGVIRSEDGAWMIPNSYDVTFIFDEQEHKSSL